MDEMITFDKDFEDRLEEFMVVFGDNDVLPASQIKKQWSIYMEFELNSCGWKALWKIPRYMCDKLDIPYPTVVIAFVDRINFENLTAEVEVIAVQGNIDLPLYHTASLARLWPTKHQNESMDIISIANTLDMYRFFYYHLWMPWDLQECDNSDWIKNNLADRLHLFFSVKDGNAPNSKARKFRTLLTEVKNMLEYLGDDGTSSTNIDISDTTDDVTNIDILTNLHLKIADLKTEIEILRTYQLEMKPSIIEGQKYWLVFNSGCTLNNYSDFLQSIRNLTPVGTKYKSAVCLQDALDSADSNDSIIIGPGKHKILSAGVLDDGAVLKSSSEDNTKVIIDSLHENSFVDFSGKYLNLENLSINVVVAQCGIIAQSGSILIKNCRVSGQGVESAQHGIVALPGADIKLENCHISGFEIGFYVSSFASLTLTNCIISDVHTPIKVCTNAAIDLTNSQFEKYKYFGVYLETNKSELNETNVTDISSIKSKINAKIVDCIFRDSEPVFLINNSNNAISV